MLEHCSTLYVYMCTVSDGSLHRNIIEGDTLLISCQTVTAVPSALNIYKKHS